MNPGRRATPDSEAVASSEDERPWPSSTSFGKLSMNETRMPGLPGGIWSTQKRGSFRMGEAAQRNAALEARLGATNPAHSALRPGNTPSPSVSDGTGALPFAIPLQPTPKLGRSLSHSQGQREFVQGPGGHAGATGQSAVLPLPLGLLQEEADTESESDFGGRLTQTTSHPPIGSVMRTSSTFPLTYDSTHDASNGKLGLEYAAGQQQGDRRLEAAFANMSFDPPQRRAQWQSSLGWDDVPNVNESRRHSLADIPTRRGSSAGGEAGFMGKAFGRDGQEPDLSQLQGLSSASRPSGAERPNDNHGMPSADVYGIPDMYRQPYARMDDAERNARRDQQQIAGTGLQWGPNGGRPRKQLYIVSFKCSRVDVFYLLDNTGLSISEGDMVIVEADRGQDLGTVQHARVTPEVAREKKKKYSEEQYKWLMMYSRNKAGGVNPNAQVAGESNRDNSFAETPNAMQGMLPRENYTNLKPKAIKRLANDHEIKMLAEKEGNEAKAKRTCQQKVAHLRLEMEILDAEWQWDFQKLIFYYYADKYINFKDLITELYRIYKTRIWLSAINPASFSQHALGQPPSGIGPGAVSSYHPYNLNNNYTMAYGEDGDPYGARMPYSIPFETYTPNYPSIPGVANSFAPPPFQLNPYMFYPGAAIAAPGAAMPQRVAGEEQAPGEPGNARTNAMPPYNTFYARAHASENQQMGSMNLPSPTGPTSPSANANLGAQNQIWGMAPFSPSQPSAPGRQMGLPHPIGTRPLSHGNGDGQSNASEEQQRSIHADSAQSQSRPLDPTRSGFTYPGAHSGFNTTPTATTNNNSNPARRETFTEQLNKLADPADRARMESRQNRAQNLDRYLTTLPSPAEFHADETSREH